jgi:hypothetical protein
LRSIIVNFTEIICRSRSLTGGLYVLETVNRVSQFSFMPMTCSGASGIRSRQIGDPDLPGVIDLLARGFDRPRRFWSQVTSRLAQRPVPAGLPRYGYVLESDGAAIGAVLLIFSDMPTRDGCAIRCNVSSWFVEPAFRGYASLFVSKALSHKNVTYLNITPAPHTLPIVRAQGYSQYSSGTFVALPALQFPSRNSQATVVEAEGRLSARAEPFERELLAEHARYGCISLWCATTERAYPFVFRPRVVKGIVACAQLVYCSSVDDFVRFAGPIGRFLAARGRPFVVLDSNGPIPGLVGKYLDARMPKYFKGPDRPRLGDLAYTEAAMFGV